MPTGEHEGLIQLFEERLFLAPELLQLVYGLTIPPDASVRKDDAAFSDLKPPEYRADLVLVVEAASYRRSVIVEIQRRKDAKKVRSWPRYVAARWSTTGDPVVLLVLATTRAVARWAARPIDTGHPGFVLRPLVLGPENVPLVTAERDAIANPELAVLSAVIHGRGREARAVGTAAVAGAVTLPEDDARLCVDLILNALSGRARREVEKIMVQHYEPRSEFLRKYLETGRQQGREEGREEGREVGREEGREEATLVATANAILRVLDARGLRVSRAVERRIRKCTDLPTLELWHERAVTVERATKLFD